MNNQPIKRRDPFAKPLKQETPKKEEIIKEEEEIVEEIPVEEEEYEEIEEIPVQQPVVRPQVVKQTQRQQLKPQRQNSKVAYVPQDNANRQKYTSTMDVQLRRKIKVVCAMRGIMFSEFIEIACMEKLNREGER